MAGVSTAAPDRNEVICGWVHQGQDGCSQYCCCNNPARASKLPKQFRTRVIQAVRKETAASHLALHGNFSSPVSVKDPVRSSKDAASLVVWTRKKIFWLGVRIFCDWCHKWRTSKPPSPTSPVFCWSFYWKLGYNPSLLILWMTCWPWVYQVAIATVCRCGLDATLFLAAVRLTNTAPVFFSPEKLSSMSCVSRLTWSMVHPSCWRSACSCGRNGSMFQYEDTWISKAFQRGQTAEIQGGSSLGLQVAYTVLFSSSLEFWFHACRKWESSKPPIESWPGMEYKLWEVTIQTWWLSWL